MIGIKPITDGIPTMKKLIKLMALTLMLCAANNVLAEVRLSTDGKILSGVEIQGSLYDVHFGDGVINQVYPLSVITAGGWNAFADSAWQSVTAALNRYYPNLPATSFNGCQSASCELFVPLRPTGSSTPDQYAMGRVVKSGSGWQGLVWPQYDANTNTRPNGQVTIMTFFPTGTTNPDTFALSLEEPIDGKIHGGIGNLRGWALADGGIERVEIYIDGKYMFDAPYGGDRKDIAAAYPNVPDAQQSGFSLAYGYSNLGVGQHTIMARAISSQGAYLEATSNFEVIAFHKNFIRSTDEVDTDDASADFNGDEVMLNNVIIDGKEYDLKLKWRTSEQGFEIIEARR